MEWFNEPPTWRMDGTTLHVVAAPRTDFWRKTHYGFIRDNGHAYLEQISGDFVAEVNIVGAYTALYDQAGLLLRADDTTWIKCGIEFVDGVQQASVVVTREYSDWSVTPLHENPAACRLRVTYRQGDVEVQYSLDGQQYHLLRVAHLTHAATIAVGPMCAAPEGAGFAVAFEQFTIRRATPATSS